MKRTLTLLAGDTRHYTRDAMYVLILCAPVLIFGLLRFGIPELASVLWTQFAFELTPYTPLIFIFLCTLPPMIYGMLIGLVLLDEQDEDIIRFVAVTPLSRNGYIRRKFVLPTLMAFLFLLVFFWFSGFGNGKLLRFIPLAMLLSTEALLAGMFLVGLAENKVEGLALSKAMGIYIVALIVGFLVQSPVQYVAGLSPVFWIAEAYWADSFLVYLINLGVGIFTHTGLFILLYRRFNRKIF
ncbi:MAG: hypothetical protein K9N46_01730 [Candidatus Marinimicrobia bacterium]|nr:hypothetical protein [Candidatus Neomarinimicrobiota bacterium]MCF7827803.1 hypothetical protein [Candidatus Neomarinimicrobiota bacterium]MCF7879442.1 hypothetical protein [Candidatus Neomarinimicrobiota bacterium]